MRSSAFRHYVQRARHAEKSGLWTDAVKLWCTAGRVARTEMERVLAAARESQARLVAMGQQEGVNPLQTPGQESEE